MKIVFCVVDCTPNFHEFPRISTNLTVDSSNHFKSQTAFELDQILFEIGTIKEITPPQTDSTYTIQPGTNRIENQPLEDRCVPASSYPGPTGETTTVEITNSDSYEDQSMGITFDMPDIFDY